MLMKLLLLWDTGQRKSLCGGVPGSRLPNRCSGLRGDDLGVRHVVLFGGGLCQPSSADSVAERLRMPCVWRKHCLEGRPGSAAMRSISRADLSGRGEGFRRQTEGIGNLVSRDSEVLPRGHRVVSPLKRWLVVTH